MDSVEYDETDQYQKVLNQFRERVSDVITPKHTDAVLLRWLRAKNYNLTEAVENFRGNHESRKLYRVDTMPDWYSKPELFEKYEGTTFLGFAKDGSGIRYVLMDVDFYGFIFSSSFFDHIIFFCYLMERDLKVTRDENIRTGRKSDQIMFILDLRKFPLQQYANKYVIEIGLEYMRLFQDHYPEVWKYFLFVNVPPLFNALYNIFKPILRENFVRTLKIATKENTKELLRTYIDDDVLPAFLGGKRVDSTGDPYCKEFIKQTAKIPEKYYLRNCLHFIDLTDPDVDMTIINAGRVFNLPLVVKEARSRMKFEIRTENGSIDFIILFRNFEENPDETEIPAVDEFLDPHDEKSNVEVVGERCKIQSHIAPCNVTTAAFRAGIYIMQFGNTSSWFTSKKLFYRVTLLPPEDSTK